MTMNVDGVLPPPQGWDDAPGSVLDRLQNAYGRQQWAIDHGDASGWAGTFHVDGVFDSQSYPQVVRGHRALCEFALTVHDGSPGLRHLVTNLHVVTARPQSVLCRLSLMIIGGDDRGAGQQVHRVVDVEDTWQLDPLRLVRRQVGDGAAAATGSS